jgi:lysyl-tRNA synthetase class 1
MARSAIDGYLDAVDGTLFVDDIYAWNYVERAIDLAASIGDQGRVQRAKAILFKFRAICESRDPRYAYWRFHEIAWGQARVLGLTDTDRAEIVQVLESQLALRSHIEDPQNFDRHLATTAAEALKLWRDFAGQRDDANRAAHTAGAAFEAAASQATGLTAIAWLTDQLARYRQLGDEQGVSRIERAIRARAQEAQSEMKRISVPLNVKPEEIDAWADRVAGENLDEALKGFGAVGIVRRDSTERAILDNAQSTISAHIPIMITGRDGFTKATIGSVKDDLDSRIVHHAAQLLSQQGPWLNLAWQRIQAKHGAELDAVLEWLSHSPCFPPERMPFIREGLTAWFDGDHVKTVHVLVPQVESALRDLLPALGGVVTKPDRHGGSQKISLGEVLADEKFTQVPEAIRFHMQVLYQDSRGMNVRNELAHGLLAFELLGLGLTNIVVHSIVLIGTLRLKPASDAGA